MTISAVSTARPADGLPDAVIAAAILRHGVVRSASKFR
jgi:hypothetical protein